MNWSSGTAAALLMLLSTLGLINGTVAGEKQYGPGVTDTEIKIGNIMPYSGAASAYGTIGRAEAAYFAMVNDQGGVNGRKINFISRDDGYNPPKTVEMARQLVEQDQVLATFNTLGTPPNTAIQGYLNDNKVPQLFVATGANKWNDPKNHPWTIGWQPSYQIEARIYARYILKNMPNAKIALLYQDDDFGKDYLIGLREGLGDKADKMIVAIKTYETTDATIDSQIVALQGSGADVMVTAAIPKFAAQAIRKIYDIGWKPTHFLSNVAISVKQVMQPAGPEKGVGIISAGYVKEPTDPQWHNTSEYKDWLAWMQKYNSSGNITDANNVYGYSVAQTIVHVLKAAGNNLTRENLMKQAASIHGLKLPMLLPGIIVSTAPDDFAPIKQMQLKKFDGTTWQLFGEVVSAIGEPQKVQAELQQRSDQPRQSATTVHADKRVALVVGNSAYLNAPRLADPVNDARLMAETLESLGFVLVGGGPQLDLNEGSFRRVIQEFSNQLQRADLGLFYYAGHGVQVRGSNYLVPVGANPTREADVDLQMMDVNIILRQMEESGTKFNLVILDACRNNPFGGRGLRATDSGLAQMQAPEGTLISFATQPGKVAQDGTGGHSLYTEALAQVVRKPGLKVFDAFNEVGLVVGNATGGAQQPWFSASPVKGDFYFAEAPPAESAAQVWAIVQNATSIAVLEDFVRQFGSTIYGSVARARLEGLKKAQASVVVPPVAPAVPSDPCGGAGAVTVSLSRSAAPLSATEECSLKPKDVFKECASCPEMVVVPAGSFTMGSSPATEAESHGYEGPQHVVTIARQFAVGPFAVTFDEWDACVADGGCNGYKPSDQGWGRGHRPVINVSWDEAQAYVAWLAKKTGKPYQLLSEAEREYVTRAGTTTPFWWGSSISTSQANYDGNFTYGDWAKGEYRQRTVPVYSFAPNPWGLYQVHGNVYDWTEDCDHDSYTGAPTDGSPWTSGNCSRRIVRGGSWNSLPRVLRSADRGRYTSDTRSNSFGFRVGRTLEANATAAQAWAVTQNTTSVAELEDFIRHFGDSIYGRMARARLEDLKPAVQRVVLYEEDDQQGRRYIGSAIWRTETVSPGPGLAPELAALADIEIPERRMTVIWSLRRNTDKALPASHTIEIMFNLPADFPGGGIANVPGILMKQGEQARGTPLAGLVAKVTNGIFLIGLSAVDTDVQRNLQLLKEQSWIDIPIVYTSGGRAILAMEKGPPVALAEVLAAVKK